MLKDKSRKKAGKWGSDEIRGLPQAHMGT